ncbi:peptidylprolyl isomerase [Candidatus Pacearchaeota archaeon]|nr:peptidylprolyl isomerase [Candidatus Pacearchaeota archaeon]
MALNKKDFIEIEFTARVRDTQEVFDSNIKKDLENSNLETDTKPFIFALGENMFLKGVEDFLLGKEIGKYKIDLEPEQAFGKRDSRLVQIVPMKVFRQQNVRPIQGAMFNFDGRIAKILSVSGGRVIVDFNNPVSGKAVTYEVNVLRKIEDLNEKIKSFIQFIFRRDLKFELKEKELILEVEKEMRQFVELFAEKFKDIFGVTMTVKEVGKEINEISKEVNLPQ